MKKSWEVGPPKIESKDAITNNNRKENSEYDQYDKEYEDSIFIDRGDCLFEEQSYDKAANEYKTALERTGNDHKVMEKWMKACYATKRSDYKKSADRHFWGWYLDKEYWVIGTSFTIGLIVFILNFLTLGFEESFFILLCFGLLFIGMILFENPKASFIASARGHQKRNLLIGVLSSFVLLIPFFILSLYVTSSFDNFTENPSNFFIRFIRVLCGFAFCCSSFYFAEKMSFKKEDITNDGIIRKYVRAFNPILKFAIPIAILVLSIIALFAHDYGMKIYIIYGLGFIFLLWAFFWLQFLKENPHIDFAGKNSRHFLIRLLSSLIAVIKGLIEAMNRVLKFIVPAFTIIMAVVIIMLGLHEY